MADTKSKLGVTEKGKQVMLCTLLKVLVLRIGGKFEASAGEYIQASLMSNLDVDISDGEGGLGFVVTTKGSNGLVMSVEVEDSDTEESGNDKPEA